MTTPRTPRTLPLLLAFGLAATVALPAATALNLAAAGDATADAAWTATSGLGGGTACPPGHACTMQYQNGGAASGSARSSVGWHADADVDEQAFLDLAADAAARAKAEADAKLAQAMALKDRVHVEGDVAYDVETEGGLDAAWDSEARADGRLGVDGATGVRAERDVDLNGAQELKGRVEAEARAEATDALAMIAGLLGQLQAHVSMGVSAAVDGASQVGGAITGAIGGALGVVQSTQVNVHHELDVGANLGAVPSIEVPKIAAPSLGVDGSASLVAQAAATAEGALP